MKPSENVPDRHAWPPRALAKVSAFCTQAAPHPALICGSLAHAYGAQTPCGHAIRQHRRLPADVLAYSPACPWPANTFLRIAASADTGCLNPDGIAPQLAEWLRICRPQGSLLLLCGNPCLLPQRTTPKELDRHPPQALAVAAEAAGWHVLGTLYFRSGKTLPVPLLDTLFARHTAPVYALHLQKRVYAVPPAQGRAVGEDVELAALGIARGQPKPL